MFTAQRYEPVNWQPPGSTSHVRIDNNGLEIHGVRQKPRENVRVIFESVFLVSALNLSDSGDFLLCTSEKYMHRAILAKLDLLEEGFQPVNWKKKNVFNFVYYFLECRVHKALLKAKLEPYL